MSQNKILRSVIPTTAAVAVFLSSLSGCGRTTNDNIETLILTDEVMNAQYEGLGAPPTEAQMLGEGQRRKK